MSTLILIVIWGLISIMCPADEPKMGGRTKTRRGRDWGELRRWFQERYGD